VLLPEVIYLVLEALVSLLEIEEARLQLPPMGDARLNTETR
jgi:hypothetical protein